MSFWTCQTLFYKWHSCLILYVIITSVKILPATDSGKGWGHSPVRIRKYECFCNWFCRWVNFTILCSLLVHQTLSFLFVNWQYSSFVAFFISHTRLGIYLNITLVHKSKYRNQIHSHRRIFQVPILTSNIWEEWGWGWGGKQKSSSRWFWFELILDIFLIRKNGLTCLELMKINSS